jgi:hypothetical protein
MAVVPDYVEPRVGWRVWSVVEYDGELRLASLVYHVVWQPRAEVRAWCRRSLAALPLGRMPLHGPPAIDCCCGIYALQSAELAAPYLRFKVDESVRSVHRVIGRVSLWGRIVECHDGWRAASGYPEELYVPTGVTRRPKRRSRARAWQVAESLSAYGVPVEVVAPP